MTFKEIIRRALWPFALLGIDEIFQAREGTKWFRFLVWLYGEDCAYSSSSIESWYPEEKER